MENKTQKQRTIIIAVLMVVWFGLFRCPVIDNVIEHEETIDKIVYRLSKPGTERIILSIIQVESGGNPNAVSKTNDYGLMQINKTCWAKYYDFDRILEPEYNIQAGIEIFNLCLNQSNNNIEKALKLYNGSSLYPPRIDKKHKELFGESLL